MQTSIAEAAPAVSARRIAHQTRGQRHGPITRLMSPSDLGELLKPFVFLDLFETEASAFGGFGMHPHSGIATLTLIQQGSVRYEDSTGKQGMLPEHGVEWMQAGGGVWHTGGPIEGAPVRGFQLWIALPPGLEDAPPFSQYLAPQDIASCGPARVVLGAYGGATSAIAPTAPMNYLALRLRDGEAWRYEPPAGHTLAWVAISSGRVQSSALLTAGDMAVYDTSGQAIDFRAIGDAEFVLGSAVPHPHPLVLGSYSVHTSREALRRGEEGIRREGARMRAAKAVVAA